MRTPLDPECPVVAEFMESLFGDPALATGGCCPCSPNIEPTEDDIQLHGQDRLA